MRRTSWYVTVLTALIGLARCSSESAEPQGGSDASVGDAATGDSASGETGPTDATSEAPETGSDVDAGCENVAPKCCGVEYDLDADADTAGLCAAADNNECTCTDWPAAGTVQCSPDGKHCCSTVNLCTPSPRCGWVDCGEQTLPNASCPASQQVFESGRTFWCIACARDADCTPGKRCSVRLGNRMFCES